MSWPLVLAVTKWAISQCATEPDLVAWALDNKLALQRLPPPIAEQVRRQYAERRDGIRAAAAGRAA